MNYLVLKNKEVIDKFKNETPKNVFIQEFICLRKKVFFI